MFGIDVTVGLIPTAVIYISFSIVYVLNMIGGVLVSCQFKKEEPFSIMKIVESLEKIIFCALVMGSVVIATNLMANGLFNIDSSLAEMVTNVISVAAFALIFAKGFLQKTVSLMEKVKYMLEINDTSKKPNLDDINSKSLSDLVFNPDFEPNVIEAAQYKVEDISDEL